MRSIEGHRVIIEYCNSRDTRLARFMNHRGRVMGMNLLDDSDSIVVVVSLFPLDGGRGMKYCKTKPQIKT